MEALRTLATELGFRDPVTVGASGNLLYGSRATAKADEAKLARALVKRMGKGVVVVRSLAEMDGLTKNDAFAGADDKVPDKWRFVALLAAPSSKPLPPVPADGAIRILGRTSREVFYTMSAPSSAAIGMSALLERALGTPVTVRNWNVVRDLAKRLSG